MIIEGKIGLITGGAQGIGKAFAISLLQKNVAGVCIVDMNLKGKETAKELSTRYRIPVEYMHCDVSNYNQLKNAFDFTKKKFGFIDIVCNNAGIVSVDRELEKLIKSFRVNLEAAYYGVMLSRQYMNIHSEGRGGVVINMASLSGLLFHEGWMVYTATKTGVVGLTRAAGTEESFSQCGVRINCMCPSYTDTTLIYRDRVMLETKGYPILSPEFVARGFIQLIEDDSKNGAVMRVTSEKGIDYKRFRVSKPPSRL